MGYEPEELMCLGPEEVLGLVHPDDKDQMTSVLSEVIQNEGKRQNLRYSLKKKDGSWTPREATLWVDRDDQAGKVVIAIDRPAAG